jgi:hypothetical protein
VEFKIRRRNFNAYEILGYGVIIVGALFIVLGFFLFRFVGDASATHSVEMERYGQFGEFIGGVVGSFWALAGVLLFFANLTYQKKEFEQQRVELEKTHKIFKQQDFSSLFLNFISQHNTLMNSLIVYGENDVEWKGSNFFVLFRQKVMEGYNERISQFDQNVMNEAFLEKLFFESFADQFAYYQNELEPYLKNLKVLFDMVYKYRSETLDKSEYYSYILKSTLSLNELFLIYHVGRSNIYTDLKKFQKVFTLFENLPPKYRMEYIIERTINLGRAEKPKSQDLMKPMVHKKKKI